MRHISLQAGVLFVLTVCISTLAVGTFVYAGQADQASKPIEQTSTLPATSTAVQIPTRISTKVLTKVPTEASTIVSTVRATSTAVSTAQTKSTPIVSTIPSITLTQTVPITRTAADGRNPCEEGDYLDLETDACEPLDKAFGFDFAAFDSVLPADSYTLEECTSDALSDLLMEIEDSGGTVFIPACELTVERKLFISSNTLIQGAGIGETILQVADDFTEVALQARHAKNVIVRDLTLDGAASASMLLSAWYADNILFERIEARNAEGSGLNYRYATNVTVRYSQSYGHKKWHGIASKDCFPSSSSRNSDEVDCQAQFDAKATEVDETPGVLWSNNVALYSNDLYDNGDYGLDSHASLSEVAGNWIRNNRYGAKFPDGSNLWIHNNRIEESSRWGLFLYNTVDIEEQVSSNIAFYNNNMGANGIAQIRVKSPAKDIFLLDNSYEGRLNMIQNKGGKVYRCTGTDDVSLFSYGSRPESADKVACNLTDVASIFE